MVRKIFVGLMLLLASNAKEAASDDFSTSLVALGAAENLSVESRISTATSLANRIDTMSMLDSDEFGNNLLVYGDRYGILRVSKFTQSGLQEVWRSNALEGAIFQVRTDDLDSDGRQEIIVRSDVRGHVHVYDSNFVTAWASINLEYVGIQALDVANMDSDAPLELVILTAEGYIDYLDGESLVREFRSNQTYDAEDIEVGNVDIDATPEIVLNTGIVLDALDAEPEWATDYFGTSIELFDIDGDGIDEILAHELLQPMIIYDAESKEEKPLR